MSPSCKKKITVCSVCPCIELSENRRLSLSCRSLSQYRRRDTSWISRVELPYIAELNTTIAIASCDKSSALQWSNPNCHTAPLCPFIESSWVSLQVSPRSNKPRPAFYRDTLDYLPPGQADCLLIDITVCLRSPRFLSFSLFSILTLFKDSAAKFQALPPIPRSNLANTLTDAYAYQI